MPYKYVKPTSTRLLRGRSTPSILAIVHTIPVAVYVLDFRR
jgi:hypothetical protein